MRCFFLNRPKERPALNIGHWPRAAELHSLPLAHSNASSDFSMPNQPFIVEPHFRLQEWVAKEKGYFKDEGLDYVFQELIQSSDGRHHDRGDRVGASNRSSADVRRL
jgi:hypothetical protein